MTLREFKSFLVDEQSEEKVDLDHLRQLFEDLKIEDSVEGIFNCKQRVLFKRAKEGWGGQATTQKAQNNGEGMLMQSLVINQENFDVVDKKEDGKEKEGSLSGFSGQKEVSNQAIGRDSSIGSRPQGRFRGRSPDARKDYKRFTSM